MSKELTEQEFKQRLRDAGWSEKEIEAEWKSIQEDDESGYDGP
jgi:hypothetical protein